MSSNTIRPRAALRGALVAICSLALAVALPVSAPAAAQQEPADEDSVTAARLEGATRHETAANIATFTFEDIGVAVIATAQDYPDALAASFAAGSINGPVLLTNRDTVPGPTWDALAELGVEDVVLIGGGAAISAEVEASLEGEGYATSRVAGADRYDTAAQVALTYSELIEPFEGDRTAILASGRNFPDALSAGPLAAGAQMPLFLTPTHSTVEGVTEALEALDIERIIVVGGTAAVSSAVVEFYQDRGYTVERFAGQDRTETAVVVAQNLIERVEGFSPAGILLARGDHFPDALAASSHAAVIGAPLLLSANPRVLGPTPEGYLFDLCPEVDFVRALGGTAAITDAVLNEAVLAADQCREPGDFIGDVSPDDRESDPFPGEWPLAQFVEVRHGEHDRFERIVFEFDGDLPGWQTAYDDLPLLHPQSGEEIPLEGDAYIGTSFAPAVATWGDGDYTGPERITVDGDIVTEVVLVQDFEDGLMWAIGVDHETAYAVGYRDGPTRFIIDVAHEWPLP